MTRNYLMQLLFGPRPALAALLAAALGAGACGPAPRHEVPVDFERYAVKTVCPQSGTLTPGIDVSKWQSTIDWAAVKNSGLVEFAIARATHGINVIDEKFDANFKGIKAQGLVRGVYQYFEPGQDAIQQADLMLQMIKDSGGLLPTDLPPVLDMEATGSQTPATIQQKALAWLQHVEAKTGKKPLVYTAAYFAQANLGTALAAYPVWIANYKYTTTGACPLMPDNAWSNWSIWQYSDKGSVSGISGNVDLNVFDGSLAELKTFIAQSNTTPPPPPPPPPPTSGPQLTLQVGIQSMGDQPRDTCTLYGSEGIFDWPEGQGTEVHVDVKNSGPGDAKNVRTALSVEEPYLRGRKWNIYSDKTGSFLLDAADGAQVIGHDDPTKSFELALGDFSVGETKRIVLFVEGAQPSLGLASLGAADHPELRVWVKHTDDGYAKESFDSTPTDSSGQIFNGGDLRAYAQADVLGAERCDGVDNDCNGDVDDGCEATDGGLPAADAGMGGDASTSGEPQTRPSEGCAIANDGPASSASWGLLVVLMLMVWRRRSSRSS